MTFEQLRTFVMVVESGSFSQASRVMGLSQPAVSLHIQALERDLGHQLFDRAGRKTRLSIAGHRFLEFALQVTRDREALESDLAALDSPLQGSVGIGAINSAGIYTLPPLLAEFRRTTPSVQTRLNIGAAEQIIEMFLAGQVELAVVDDDSLGATGRDIQINAYLQEELVLVVPPDHPWATRKRIAPAELFGESLLMRARGSRSRAHLEGALSRLGVKTDHLTVALELDSTEAIKQAACSGLGIGFVPEGIIQRELAWGAVAALRLDRERITRQLWLCSPKRKDLPPNVGALRIFLLQRAATASQSPPPVAMDQTVLQ